MTERSLAGQIKYWASLGRALEKLLHFDEVIALRKFGKAKSLSECPLMVGSAEGNARLNAVLDAKPFPHFSQQRLQRLLS